jgi:Bacterial regulatory protein, Fis family
LGPGATHVSSRGGGASEELAGLEADVTRGLLCATFGKESSRPGLRFAPDALALLRPRPWRGNVRQLRNFIERLTILAEGEVITASEVEHELQRQPPVDPWEVDASSTVGSDQPMFPALGSQRSEAEHGHILSALKLAHGSRTVAAKLLGISRRTIYNKLHLHGMLGSPEIDTFTAAPPALLAAGGRTTLTWTVRDATILRLEPPGENVTALPSKEVSVTETTTYWLIADNEQGQASKTLTVSVGP